MDNKVLLLTACITPGGMVYTALQDPKEREKHYLNALRWYLANTEFPIVLCENTNYQLPDEFQPYIDKGRLEYLTFDGNNSFDKSKGKGLGEALIIKYAIENSHLISKTNVIMKMTGRQILVNIGFVAEHCSGKDCVYANMAKENLGIMEALSQFYICPKSFYTNCFFSGINKLNDSRFYYFEHLLYDSMKEWKNNKKGKISEFWMPLKIKGVSGSSNTPLEIRSFAWLRSLARFILHKMGVYRQFANGIFTDEQIKEFRFG